MKPAVLAALAARLAAPQFASAAAARRGLQKEPGVARPAPTVRRWVKKLQGVLRECIAGRAAGAAAGVTPGKIPPRR